MMNNSLRKHSAQRGKEMKKNKIVVTLCSLAACCALASCNANSSFQEYMTVGAAPTAEKASTEFELVEKQYSNKITQWLADTAKIKTSEICFKLVKTADSDKHGLAASGTDEWIFKTHSVTDKINHEYGITLKVSEITDTNSVWSKAYDATTGFVTPVEYFTNKAGDNTYVRKFDIDFSKVFATYAFKDGDAVVTADAGFAGIKDGTYSMMFQQARYANDAFTLLNGTWITFGGTTDPINH